MAEEKKLFKVTIDNITVEVEPGTSILMAARRIGGDVAPPAGRPDRAVAKRSGADISPVKAAEGSRSRAAT